jgi:hypothetical protein
MGEMIKIKLEPDEIAVCNLIGRNRALIARSSGVKDVKMGDQDGAEADVLGFMGEYAFAKHFNVFPDLGLVPRSGSADGILKGYKYDIKTTTYKNGRLLSTIKDNDDVDMYVLAIVEEPFVFVAGYALKDELRKESNLIDLGHGKGYGLNQEQLREFK